MERHGILVVDDEPASVATLRRTLADEYRVFTAGGGREGLEILARENISLVIADQRMPSMSGTEFLAQAWERYPETIRILLTGYTDMDTLLEAINEGKVYHYVSKPWDARELRVVIKRALERYEAQAQMKNLAEELRVALEKVTGLDEVKTRFLAIAAHELRTPLQLLQSSLELLYHQVFGPLPDRQQELVATARKGVSWLVRTVNEMTNLSRLTEKKARMHWTAIALADLLQEISRDLELFFHQRHLSFSPQVADGLPRMRGDSFWLKQALVNLLMNAIRFTPDYGRVEVSIGAGDGHIQVAITDTGIGIPAEEQNRIFEPFYGGHDPMTHASGTIEFRSAGLGLGLAIAKAVVEEHGGHIWVASAVNQGSTFYLRFPVSREG